MSNPYDLALIGKLGEEASELAKACARATIQGLDETCEEQEGRTNAMEIVREFHDCRAVAQVIHERSVVNMGVSPARYANKVKGFRRWLVLLKNKIEGINVPVE